MRALLHASGPTPPDPYLETDTENKTYDESIPSERSGRSTCYYRFVGHPYYYPLVMMPRVYILWYPCRYLHLGESSDEMRNLPFELKNQDAPSTTITPPFLSLDVRLLIVKIWLLLYSCLTISLLLGSNFRLPFFPLVQVPPFKTL